MRVRSSVQPRFLGGYAPPLWIIIIFTEISFHPETSILYQKHHFIKRL